MPNRIIRGELLNSEKYWSVSIEARQFFMHAILVADDFGLLSGTSFWLRRNCFGPEGCEPKRLENLLTEVNDHHLVVAYEVNGVRYLWIPKFGNWPRAKVSKYPVNATVFKELAKELQCIRHASDMHVHRTGNASALETVTVTVTETETETEKPNPVSNLPCSSNLPSEDKVKRKTLLSDSTSDEPNLGLSPFAKFWAAYPRKEGKGSAEKAWSKIARPTQTVEMIESALSWQRKSEQWQAQNGQFIPLPATYLNQRRWEDEPKVKSAADRRQQGVAL